MTKRKLKVYCDTNIYSRPFDNSAHLRIALEIEACFQLFLLAKLNQIILISSDILLTEISQSDIRKKLQISLLVNLCHQHIEQTESIRNLAQKLFINYHFKPRDSLHLASALKNSCDVFLTCDDQIIRKWQKAENIYNLQVKNPVDFIHSYDD